MIPVVGMRRWRRGLVGALVAVIGAVVLSAGPAHAADQQTCTPWTTIMAGTRGSVCVATSGGLTDAWAEIRNSSGVAVQAELWVYIKDSALPHRVCGGVVANGDALRCNAPLWTWVPSPRWAKAWFRTGSVTLWSTTATLP
ncbi:hypothetical protein ACFFSW_17030 [Saccharothrix longispora]|uniref:hypothetical protein n=1 Tax=Saccharothrix longispora TaxID=33920 RepID=UPI0035EFC718